MKRGCQSRTMVRDWHVGRWADGVARSLPAGRVRNRYGYEWFPLVAGCFALFMAILDNLVVNVALPTISEDFSPSGTQLQWII